MKVIIRQLFLDQTWDSAHLNDAARFWLALYEVAAKHYGYAPLPKSSLELRLWGFPRNVGEALKVELERRAVTASQTTFVVTRPVPDRLVVSSVQAETARPQLLPLGLALLTGQAFEGLAVEVRFRIAGRTKRVFGLSTYASVKDVDVTLVVVGELRNGRLLVKTVWKSHYEYDEDEYFRTTPMAGELELVGALEEYRRRGSITRPELAVVFAPVAAPNPVERWQPWIVHARFGRPRLLRLLARLLGLVGFTAGSTCLLWYWFIVARDNSKAAGVGVLTLIGGVLLWVFLRSELGFLIGRYRDTYRARVKDLEEIPRRLELVITHPSDISVELDDPALRKYSADLLAEGLTLLGEATRSVTSHGRVTDRVFRTPDRTTYAILRYSNTSEYDTAEEAASWPRPLAFEIHTFFQSGGRVSSGIDADWTFRRAPRTAATLLYSVPEADDITVVLDKHMEFVQEFLDTSGMIPLRLNMEGFAQKLGLLHESQWDSLQSSPYTLSEHLRWYLQWPLRVQRG